MRRSLFAGLVLCLVGCQQQMARQPSYRPLQPSSYFGDGLSAQPLVEGTVHRDFRAVSGKKPVERKDWERAVGLVGKLAGNPLGAAGSTADWSQYVDVFPFPITLKVLERGQDRFNIYCSMCHDRVGTGHGMIVLRGFTPPPNFSKELSRGFKLRGIELKLTEAPVGYFFEVITHGFGAMPDYASQVAPDDRWAIIAYIRALQLSQTATLADVRDASEKERLRKMLGKQE
jgi:mono/diheme cytochrome c family protein